MQPRSGLALRHGVTVLNTPGLIDAGYRDELQVLLVNTDPTHAYEVAAGRPHRPARHPARSSTCAWVEVDELDGADRGGGFGHTGR